MIAAQITHLTWLANDSTLDGDLARNFADAADTISKLAQACERAAIWLEDRQDPPRYAAEILREALSTAALA